MIYRLVGSMEGQRLVFPLHDGINTIGRSSRQAEIVLPFAGVSRAHAEIIVRRNRAEIRDLGARNGIVVNGSRITAGALSPGDEIALGSVAFTFKGDDNCGASTPMSLSDPPRADDKSTLEGSGSGRRSGFVPRLLDMLVEFGNFLVAEDAPEPACESCLERVSSLFSFRLACLFVLDEVGALELRCSYPRQRETMELPVCHALIERVLHTAKPMLLTDGAFGTDVFQSARSKGICSALAVPLISGADVMGVLYMDQDDSNRVFSARHLHRLQLLSNLVAAKLAKSKAGIEIQMATAIQRRFLSEPLSPAGFEVAARLEACSKVAGDLYESSLLPDGRYLYAIGDVAGKGIGAALVMAEALATLRALTPGAGSPLGLVTSLSQLLAERLAPNVFVTMFLGFLDPRTRRFDYVNAGHEPPILFAPGLAGEWLHSTGPPIGLNLPVRLHEESVTLAPGAMLAAWTDGIPEAMHARSRPPQLFTKERLFDCLEAMRESPAEEIADGVFGAVDEFLDGAHAQDDRTLLVLRDLDRGRR